MPYGIMDGFSKRQTSDNTRHRYFKGQIFKNKSKEDFKSQK